jgi:hypothetical protein
MAAIVLQTTGSRMLPGVWLAIGQIPVPRPKPTLTAAADTGPQKRRATRKARTEARLAKIDAVSLAIVAGASGASSWTTPAPRRTAAMAAASRTGGIG